MKFNVFGNRDNPRIILIHGALTPWQIFLEHAEILSRKYCVIVPALDGHDGTDEEFISIAQQAEKIESYYAENFGSEVFAVCGLSMGGAVTHLLWSGGRLKISNIIMDGAPLVPAGAIACSAMKSSYLSILKGSKSRNKKTLENFKKHFLPEKFLPDYLTFIDRMSEQSLCNVLDSVCKSSLRTDIKSSAKVLYIHGTTANEVLSKKSARLIKKHYPAASVVCLKGSSHCETAIYSPDRWCSIAEDFFAGR